MSIVSLVASQVHCPFCNAAQALQPSGSYVCDFCLQPFNVHDAQREEARLLDEIKAWVEQRVGGMSSSSVDVASRAFIFQQKVLPDLRRDVDRALERLGGYGQFPLVAVPVRAPVQQTYQPNPLVAYRREIFGLKSLKARLSSEEVTAFVTRDADKVAVQFMDRHLSSLVHLSNVAEAAAARSPAGYAAARRNLEVLAEEVAQSIATEGAQDPSLGAFLGALHQRFGALAELCRICEEAGSPNAISGAALAERAEAVAVRLAENAQRVEASNYAPADTMPVVVALHQEGAAARTLARWLRTYDQIAARSGLPFMAFVTDFDPLTGGASVSAEVQTELLEAMAYVIGAIRGAVALPVATDFTWVANWVEQGRHKKSMGMFGTEERVLGVEQFLAPYWVADLSFSRAQGSVFTSGQEQRALVVVDACAPSARTVVVLGQSPLVDVLGSLGSAAGFPVAMPRSSASQATSAMMQGLRSRPELLNPRLRLRGLALLPAAVATYAGGPQQRVVSTCVSDQVPIDDFTRSQVQVTQIATQRYG